MARVHSLDQAPVVGCSCVTCVAVASLLSHEYGPSLKRVEKQLDNVLSEPTSDHLNRFKL